MMEGVAAEVSHPWKNITVGFATSRKSGISDTFPAVKTDGLAALELRQKKYH
jgi:hypothetical protein